MMRRDECLVRHFFDGYGDYLGDKFVIRELPDKTDRKSPAVEAIAENKDGVRFAAEHTLVQPFAGEKSDSIPFLNAFSRLEGDSTTNQWIPSGVDVILSIPVGAIPQNEDWNEVGGIVLQWLKDNIALVPEGIDYYSIKGLPFQLLIRIEKAEVPELPGAVAIARQFPGMPFDEVVRKALSTKLPKLIACRAEKRILILEKDSPPRGNSEFFAAIKSLRAEYPELAGVDEIWVANTVAWEREQIIYFYRVWPDLGSKFKVSPASLPS